MKKKLNSAHFYLQDVLTVVLHSRKQATILNTKQHCRSSHLVLSDCSFCAGNAIHFVTLCFTTVSLYVMPIKQRLGLSEGERERDSLI